MTTVKSRFDATSTGAQQQTDDPWLSTYSRALCSIYPKDEEDCWDYLLSSQPTSVFSKSLDESTQPSSIPNKADRPLLGSSEKMSSSPSNMLSLSSSSISPHPMDSGSTNLSSSKGIDSLLAPLSPGSIPHTLCKIGFDCIDYFTSTQDDLESEVPKPTSSPNNPHMTGPAYTSRMLECLNEADWRTDIAAAVCGKRTAALERKRALSRTTSQEDVMATSETFASDDPWLQTLDRLARWEEVAYR
ncbi:hypothetical protein BX616_005586 [Lobosporangium transversale]|uniref:Uncharacterized protein n=1 Tax=Lobosporangium transversale TaxID=64571 RepID=A0A1Y2GCZ0_9FUNG|nr:hypothetical protein BCR41DRAFT_360401 [Lobosporangium transversale]KAF9915706.1 hypothetical protein BX616_005586 [Lobosporangium transversale]ORZ07304.1 hypothetical protein BCR41DRAFT_360401 [Lobosporangium transversale]|eukprot:XP_021877967.1 hypothetical protein BCR41DRAFT_360401 [Lobosporangium transversale]